MSRDWIFVPVIFQVFLTLFVYLRLLQVKKRASAAGQVDRTRVALRDDAWPDYVVQVNNNIRNQFELPVLFYVLAILLWVLDSVHGVAVAAATVFVLSRIVHAGIHLGIECHPTAAALVHGRLAGGARDGGAGALGADAPRRRTGAILIKGDAPRFPPRKSGSVPSWTLSGRARTARPRTSGPCRPCRAASGSWT